MRTFLLSITGIFLVLLAAPSVAKAADRHMFVISSNADGYGVDRCLSTGAKCGMAVAAAYCRARAYAQAASFHKIDRDNITGTIPADQQGVCPSGRCDGFVAIVCTR